ncbi:hypothetical protein ACOBQB_09730 [Streptomyces sp. G5(2025)]|uniref:hypothetical protein n=1 Tax=Streptomyces sp. G5(2025) TaxID=3406628 RepID=UPI003C1D08D7
MTHANAPLRSQAGPLMRTAADTTISDWFARADLPPGAEFDDSHPGAAQTFREWSERRVALLLCGRRFSAVRLPARLVHAAACTDVSDTDMTAAVTATLGMLGGPVICDAFSTHYYALVPCVPKRVWPHKRVSFLGTESCLGVPRTDVLTPPGTYWAVPPHTTGDLCALSAVIGMVDLGRHCLDQVSEW